MKILFIITGLNQGGAEEMLFKLLSNIDRTKFNCSVISLLDDGVYRDKLQSLGIKIKSLNMKRGSVSFFAFFRALLLSRKIKPDIVQGWMYHANLLSFFIKIFTPKVALLFNVRNGFPLYAAKTLTKIVIKLNATFSFFAQFVVNNSVISIQQHEELGFNKKNSFYLPNGFDEKKFFIRNHIYKSFRESRGFSQETKLVGNISRFHEIKNHPGLIQVFYKIKQRFSGNVFLVLCGEKIDEKNKLLREEIVKYNLEGSCILLGSVDSHLVMPAFDVFLSASFGEGFPNVLGEAMMCGVPCVATDVGDCRLILDRYGCVAPVGDCDALAKYCIEKLSMPNSEKLAIRQHIIDNYSIKNIVQQYEELYEKIYEKTNRKTPCAA